MAKTLQIVLSEFLREYQEITHKTCIEMALDFDITLSNLYMYRNGTGNPTLSTIEKIIKAAEENCPGLAEKHMNAYFADIASSQKQENVLVGIS